MSRIKTHVVLRHTYKCAVNGYRVAILDYVNTVEYCSGVLNRYRHHFSQAMSSGLSYYNYFYCVIASEPHHMSDSNKMQSLRFYLRYLYCYCMWFQTYMIFLANIE